MMMLDSGRWTQDAGHRTGDLMPLVLNDDLPARDHEYFEEVRVIKNDDAGLRTQDAGHVI